MSAISPSSKRTLQNVFAEAGDRKLIIFGSANEKMQDSRFSIVDAAVDHVAIKLLGDEQLVIPYTSMTSVKVERTQLTIRVR